MSDVLSLKIDKVESAAKNIYIEVDIRDINNKPIVYIRTPPLEIIDFTQYINIANTKGVNYITGNYDFFHAPSPGRYFIYVSVYDNFTRVKIASFESFLQIDSIPENTIRNEISKTKFNFEIRNQNNINILPDHSGVNSNFSRLEINPRISFYDIPITADIDFEKNWMYDSKFHLENYSIGFDPNEFKKKAIEIVKKKIQEALKKNSSDTTKIINNIIYSSVTKQNEDWETLISEYKNDSIQKLISMSLAQAKYDSLYNKDITSSKLSNINDSIEYYKKLASDTMNAAYKDSIAKMYKYYSDLDQIYKKILLNREKNKEIIEKYSRIINNKSVLDDISKINTINEINSNDRLEDLLNSEFLGKKQKILYGIKYFQLGTSILNGKNQSTNGGTLLNGVNFKYKLGKVYTHIFAGIKGNRMLLNRNNFKNKDKYLGITIGYGTEDHRHIELYYSHFENTTLNELIKKEKIHISGLSAKYSVNKYLQIGIENSYLYKQKPKSIGYFAKCEIIYQKKLISINQEITYKNNSFRNNNITNYSPENFLLTTSIITRTRDASISFNTNNIYSKKIETDSTEFIYSNLTSLSLSYNSKNRKISILYNISNTISKLEANIKPINVIQLSASHNYYARINKSQYQLNLTYNYNRTTSETSNNIYAEPISIYNTSSNNYSYHKINIHQSFLYMKNNTITSQLSYSKIMYNTDSIRHNLSTGISYINSGLKYFKPQIDINYSYNHIYMNKIHTMGISFSPVITFKNYLFFSITSTYIHNSFMNNILVPNDFRIQSSVIIKY